MNEHSDVEPFELAVAELNGFLLALSNICGPGFVFRVGFKKHEESCDAIIALGAYVKTLDIYSGDLKFFKSSKIEVFDLINEFVFKKIENIHQIQIESLRWRLIEYYGLISTMISDENFFNPLSGGQLYAMDMRNKEGFAFFAFSVGRYLICTRLQVRAPGNITASCA